MAPLVPGPYVVDGDEAMRRRPMPGLLAALRPLGVEVEERGKPGCPPVRLVPGQHEQGSHTILQAGGSSQELSALLMLGARLPQGLTVTVDGQLPSRPYIDLTLDTLKAFGATVQERADPAAFEVSPGLPGTDRFRVEGDWSSASYPVAASWITKTAIRLRGLRHDSAQGDRVIPDLLCELASSGPRELDLRDTPDLVPTVVACALFAEGVTEIRNVAHLRIKESDRIGVLVRELKKLGADVSELPDGLRVTPGPLRGGARLDPGGDHRMAMAFGLVSLRVGELEIADANCVSKSYPDFWSMLEAFR
jgi:3-phosphoshikimate 1-carboxyvinyltransferase